MNRENKTRNEVIESQLHEIYQKSGTFGAKNCGALIFAKRISIILKYADFSKKCFIPGDF